MIRIRYNYSMMDKVVRKRSLHDPNLRKYDLEYWLSQPPEKRLAAVDYLRRQFYGQIPRMEKVARIVPLSSI